MTRPTVSAVIPAYNAGSTLIEAVQSVMAQTVRVDELIVVDDGSRVAVHHELADLMRSDPRLRVLRQDNLGVAAARNLGVAAASGAWIAFLDADDVWHPRKIEAQLALLARHPELGGLGTGVFSWPRPQVPAVERTTCPIEQVSWGRLAVKNRFRTSSMLVNRQLLGQVGPFDTCLQGPEDYDLWLRLARRTRLANLNLPLTGYRDSHQSLSKQAHRMEQGMRRILHKLDDQQAWSRTSLLRRKAYGYHYYSCAYMHSAAGDYPLGLSRLARSIAWYPWPYERSAMRMAMARPKLALVMARRWLASRRPRTAASSSPAGTAS